RERGSAKPQEIAQQREEEAAFAAGDRLKPAPYGPHMTRWAKRTGDCLALGLQTREQMNLVLASQSPRRRELLSILGYPFAVIPSSIDERPIAGEDPESFVVRVAREKGMEVASRVSHSVVLSADPVVTIESEILGNPAA